MAQIANRLDVSLDWLLGRTDDPKINDQEPPPKRPRGDQCLQNLAGKHVMHFDLALAFVIVARPELKLRLTNIAKPRLVLNEDHRFVHSCAPACWERIRLQGVSLSGPHIAMHLIKAPGVGLEGISAGKLSHDGDFRSQKRLLH